MDPIAISDIHVDDTIEFVSEKGNFQRGYTVMTYNVNQDAIAEYRDETKWNLRKEKIIEIIRKFKPDILCIQELRTLSVRIGPYEFLSKLVKMGYGYEFAHKNVTDYSYGQAILWRRSAFCKCDSFTRWYSETRPYLPTVTINKGVKHKGILTGVCLIPLLKGNAVINPEKEDAVHFLWVFTTQISTIKEERKISVDIIGSEIGKRLAPRKETSSVLLCGDFNFDSDMGGSRLRDALVRENGLTDFSARGSPLWSDRNKIVRGTRVTEGDGLSGSSTPVLSERMDYIFGTTDKIVRRGEVILVDITAEEPEPPSLSINKYPSDHLPLVMKFKLR
jgi:endonuclease/exonuclease/phosphatase family metal-dependent hydrolase